MIEYTRYKYSSTPGADSALKFRFMSLVYSWYYTQEKNWDIEIMRVTLGAWFEFVVEYVRDVNRHREVEFMLRIGKRFFTKIKIGFSFSKSESTQQMNLFSTEKKSDSK